jgi:ubiquinone/menaquinone biosynthesis C-methylase UbiE
VLEVSCGHGGGASYLTRTLKPASYTGLDYNPDGVTYCRKHHHLPGLDFVHGDAENLPFPDESFDAVINVEASHAYPQLSRFLAEVARLASPRYRVHPVLEPGCLISLQLISQATGWVCVHAAAYSAG